MGKPFEFISSLSCLVLWALSLLENESLVLKLHFTSVDLNRQVSTYTTSQLIVAAFLFSFTGWSSFKGLILYLKIP